MVKKENIKEIIKKIFTINNLSFILIIITMITLLAMAFACTYGYIKLKNISEAIQIIGIVGAVLYIISKIKNFKFTKLEYVVFGLIVLSTLSLIDSIDINIALFGKNNRFEGLFVILTYYVLALNALNITKKTYVKIILGCILFIGLFNVGYGLLQTGIINQTIFKINGSWHYAKGLFGNSMFYAAYMSMCYPIIMGLFVKEKGKIKNIIYFILLIVFTFGSINSGAMALLVGNIVIFIYLFITSLVKLIKTVTKKEKEKLKENIFTILKVVICIVMYIALTKVMANFNSDLKKDMNELYEQSTSVTQNKVNENFGTGRIHIWKNAIKLIPDHFIFGVGIDNFRIAFNPLLIDVISRRIVDKAHNEYLQKIVCEGVFSGGLYIIFLLIIFVKNFLNKDKLYFALFLGFTCYAIQAFFSISVTRVAPVFFIIIGLLIGKNKIEENELKLNKKG